jgi:hypothetical protein
VLKNNAPVLGFLREELETVADWELAMSMRDNLESVL